MDANASETKRQRYLRRLGELKVERSKWDGHIKDLTDFITPRRSRFNTSEANDGRKKQSRIINGVASIAARTLAAGMMAGLTSPARPWVRLTSTEPRLAEVGAVKFWLFKLERAVLQVFAKSNVYLSLYNAYFDLGTPGTSAVHVEEDPRTIIRTQVYPVGSYYLDLDSKLRVDTIYRELTFTVKQLVEEFCTTPDGTVDLSPLSPQVQEMAKRKKLGQRIEVLHVIEPNRDYRPGMLGGKAKAWNSCWLESKASSQDRFLLESGYDEMPTMCPRWDVTGEDTYGNSPGMDALPDVRAIQKYEERSADVAAKHATPPMKGNSALKNKRVSLVPGDITYLDGVGPGALFEPAIVVDPRAIEVLDVKIARLEQRIREVYYANFWVGLTLSQGNTRTATEVEELREEKLLQLGPTVERIRSELLDPLVKRTINILIRNGYIEPPPEELILAGAGVKVEYISMLSQAQKLMGIAGVERLILKVTELAQLRPDVWDKVDLDQYVDESGDMLGVPPTIVRPDEAVAEIRAARAKEMAKQQQMAAVAQGAQVAKDLASAKTGEDNALTQMMADLGAPTR